MKRKKSKNKRIFKLAEDIYKLEMEVQNGENIGNNLVKMQEIMESLTLEELLELDGYLTKKLIN